MRELFEVCATRSPFQPELDSGEQRAGTIVPVSTLQHVQLNCDPKLCKASSQSVKISSTKATSGPRADPGMHPECNVSGANSGHSPMEDDLLPLLCIGIHITTTRRSERGERRMLIGILQHIIMEPGEAC